MEVKAFESLCWWAAAARKEATLTLIIGDRKLERR